MALELLKRIHSRMHGLESQDVDCELEDPVMPLVRALDPEKEARTATPSPSAGMKD